MTFDYPFVLIAFLIFVPITIIDFIPHRSSWQKNLPAELQKKLLISSVMFRVFLTCSIIALAGPRWGTGYTVTEYRRGLDTVFAIDVSRSMDIRDGQAGTAKSRLERGLSIAGESAQAISNARLAVVTGRSMGYLAVPLAYDNEAFFTFIESLNGSSMTGRSTNIEALLDAAADAFQTTSPARKAIVLISDGESHSGNVRNALNRCIRDNITVSAVAVGSDEGREVTPADERFPDAVSRRESAVMRLAAERTGGIYIDANREEAASLLSGHLLSLAQETKAGNRKTEQKQRRTFFAILAILAYAASKFIPLLPENQKSGQRSGRGVLPASIAAVLFLFSSCSEGKLLLIEGNYLNSRGRYDEAVVAYLKALEHKDSAPYAEYGIGLTLHSLDESTAALKRYDSSKKMANSLPKGEHRELRYRNHYNSGVILFEEGDFRSAAESFREALREDPRKVEAKRNLELSLLSITLETERENRAETGKENREILFDFIRQEEQKHWRSREWQPEEKNTEPDW
jgi:Ca-activated chloride channel family protein